MFQQQIGRLNELRGRVDNDLIDTLIGFLGQCQNELKHRGPVEVVIGETAPESQGVSGRTAELLNREGVGFGAWSGDQSGPGMFNPAINALNPVWGMPKLGFNQRWPDIHAAIIGVNPWSFYAVPSSTDDDPRTGTLNGQPAGYFEGVTTFMPIDDDNNPESDNNKVTIWNQGDTVTRRLYAQTIVAPGYSATGCYVLQQCSGLLTWTLSSDFLPGTPTTPVVYLDGTPTDMDHGDSVNSNAGEPYTAYDTSGSAGTNIVLTATGCATTTGFEFTGTNNALGGAAPVSIDNVSWSLAFWLKGTDNTSGVPAFIVEIETADAILLVLPGNSAYTIYYIPTGKSVDATNVTGTGYFISTTYASGTLWDGNCRHFAIEFDKAGGTLKCYINGALSATDSATSALTITRLGGAGGTYIYSGSAPSDPGTELTIFTNDNSSWDGTGSGGDEMIISQFIAFDSLMPQSRVNYIYNGGSGRPSAEIVSNTTYASGSAGYVQYSDGAGGFTSEAAFSYDAGANTLAVAIIVTTGKVTVGGEVEIDGALNHDGSTAGFYGVTPVTRPAAYTQTYSTADRTISSYTADNEGSAYSGIDNAQAGSVYAQLDDLNALRTAYENLRAFTEDGIQALNSVIDDLQANGLLQ